MFSDPSSFQDTSVFMQRVTIPQEVLSQEVGGETVILDLKAEYYFGLDEIGTRIWELLVEHGDLQQVLDQMLEEYDVEPDRLESDMRALLAELEKAGLINLEGQE